MKPTRILVFTVIIALVGFAFFCFYNQKRSKIVAQEQLMEHAEIIAEGVWALDPLLLEEYLKIACRYSNYEHLKVTHAKNLVFFETSDLLNPSSLDQLFISTRLISKVPLSTPIINQDKAIGEITVIWYCKTIYTYLITLTILALIILVIWLYLRIWQHKDHLETAVEERTAELSSTNEKLKTEITERKQLEEQFQQSQKMEAVGQLAGGVAHDFNNILQAIMGYGEMALLESKGTSVSTKLEEVMKAAERATVLVKQLLAFSRRQVLELENLNMGIVVTDFSKMIQRVIGEDIAFNIHSEPGLKTVHADKGQIEQIIMNLCVNARDAMPDGGALTIETGNSVMNEEFCLTNTWAKPGNYVFISVTDTGSGMDTETQQRIFEPFFTTKELGKGTGLGLSTVFGIVRQHEGMIHVYSEPETGTTFRIYLPMMEKAVAESAETETLAPPGGTETILLADDDECVRSIARQMLKKEGYNVLIARDGEEAINLFNECAEEIDLALLDVVMPKLGGKAVFDHITKERPETRILFASGYSAQGAHTDFILDAGMSLIQKPYRRTELLSKVREMLDA